MHGRGRLASKRMGLIKIGLRETSTSTLSFVSSTIKQSLFMASMCQQELLCVGATPLGPGRDGFGVLEGEEGLPCQWSSVLSAHWTQWLRVHFKMTTQHFQRNMGALSTVVWQETWPFPLEQRLRDKGSVHRSRYQCKHLVPVQGCDVAERDHFYRILLTLHHRNVTLQIRLRPQSF